jgi:hypothetical protein
MTPDGHYELDDFRRALRRQLNIAFWSGVLCGAECAVLIYLLYIL